MGVRGPIAKPADRRQRRAPAPSYNLQVVGPERRRPPPAPRGLLKESRSLWRAYWRSEVAQVADPKIDRHRVERWIRDVDEYHRLRASLTLRDGRLVWVQEGSQGQVVLNPLLRYLDMLDGRIQRAEMELGLTPLARLRLGITAGQAALTAAELNRQLSQPDREPTAPAEPEPWEAEWQEAGG